jgi:2-polyprenyl-3-methyl-5-hydroxy-6-metoxy-1,4-benzoquinol methylase
MNNEYFDLRENCPACGSSNHMVLYSQDYTYPPIGEYLLSFYASQGGIELDYLKGARFVLRECTRCGMVFQYEIPNESLMHKLYEEWIDPETASRQRHTAAGLDYYLHYLQEIMTVIRYSGKTPGDLDMLDFGMGWGQWCLAARALGCNIYGTEFSKAQSSHAQRNGINTLDWANLPGYRFDFINTEQVFEHLPDPLSTLLYLKNSLKEDGIIKISVPDGSDLKRRLRKNDWKALKGSRNSLNLVSPLEHINCFKRNIMINMAESAGLKQVTIPLHIQYMCTIFRKPLASMGKNLLLPLYRDVFHRGIYLFFQNNGNNIF